MLYTLQYFNCWFRVNEAVFQKFKWVGNVLLMCAALSVAVSADWATQAWPFLLYTVGAGMWMYAGILMRDKALIGLNAFFVAIDVYGLVIRL